MDGASDVPVPTVASGKTLALRAIHTPEPVVIHRNVGAPRYVRRSRKLLRGWKSSYVANQTYVNPARDLRKGRKLKGQQ